MGYDSYREGHASQPYSVGHAANRVESTNVKSPNSPDFIYLRYAGLPSMLPGFPRPPT